jgi:hypothetical protein
VTDTQSILGKLRLLGLSTAHSALGALINLNDLGAVEQLVRDLAKASREVNDAAVVARHRADKARELVGSKLTEQEKRTTRIKAIVSDGDDGNDGQALPLQMAFNAEAKNLPKLEKERDEAIQDAKDLTDAAALVEGRLEAMRLRVRQLKDRRETADAQEDVSEALGASLDVTDSSLDDTLTRLEQEADEDVAVARDRFKRSIGQLQESGEADEAVAAAQADLAALKAELAGTPTGAGSQA